MAKDTFTTLFCSGLRYGKAHRAAMEMAQRVKAFLAGGGEKVTIEVHCKELYELREENERLRRKLNMEQSAYHNMIFFDEEV